PGEDAGEAAAPHPRLGRHGDELARQPPAGRGAHRGNPRERAPLARPRPAGLGVATMDDTTLPQELKDAGWTMSADGKSIAKAYKFRSFRDALAWMVRAGFEAEAMDHHP